MTMRGRPPTPISERIAALAGNAVAGVKPSPLDNVNPFDNEEELDAWKLWEYVVPELIANYSVGKGDQPIVEGLCYWYEVWKTARLEMAEHKVDGQRKVTVIDAMGSWKKHPAIGVVKEAWGEFVKCALQLGLTPLARPRIKVWKESDLKLSDQPFSILQFGRNRSEGPPPPDSVEGVQDAG